VELLGYTQPVVARPAQAIDLKVSTTQPTVTAEVVRLGLTEGPVLSTATFPGRRQELVSGSYFLADLGDGLDGAAGLTAQLWFFATRLGGRQCLMAGLGPDGGWEVAIGPDGRLSAATLTAEGEVLRAVSAGPYISEQRWYFTAVCWHDTGRITIAVAPRRSPSEDPEQHDLGPVRWPRRVSVAAAVPAGRPLRCFDGKVDTPRLFAGVLPPDALAALAADAPAERITGLRHEWRFGAAAATPPFRVRDHGPGRRDGTLVNVPTLGVTGRNWNPASESFVLAPGQYQAAHFHSDDLGDAGWETDWRFEVPADWRSGVYAIRLRAGHFEDTAQFEDTVPFIVTAAGRPRAAAAVLLPTFSYLAYANEHASWERPIKSSIGGAAEMIVTDADRFTSQHRLLSLYELHEDGSGTCISSWRRPVLNFRPGYHLPLVRGPHQFSADLELLHWLESADVDVDVITDDDLHRDGVRAVEPYRVVLTGSHPEYVSAQLLDGLDRYLDSGGRLMYLGGNGFYWVTTAAEDDPWVIEVRRGLAGTRVWGSPPGELHQAMTGERGGLWRHRGRSPQALTGVGFTAQGFDRSLPYQVSPNAPGFMLAGIDSAVLMGEGGSVLGGAAGFEIDRMDTALGTPPDAVLVASARGFSDAYQGAVEDVTTADSQQGGSVSELVRSDVVFFPTASGGAVFSVGSIAWCGALRDTAAGRLTGNVLSRFLDPAPFTGGSDGA
jgi:N,N-dimethylformamidase